MPFGPDPPPSAASTLGRGTAADLPALVAIRDTAGDDALSDPVSIDAERLACLIDQAAVVVARERQRPVGFCAVDRASGAIVGLLVLAEQRGKGTGRLLLAMALSMLKDSGCREAAIIVSPGGDAVRHYRAAGWIDSGTRLPTGGYVLKKPL